MTESPQLIGAPIIEPQSVGSQVIDDYATNFISTIQDELEELSIHFHDTLTYIDKLIELESIDFEQNEAEFLAKAEELNDIADHKKTSLSLLKISKCEYDFEELYLKQLSQLEDSTNESYPAYNKNFESLYDEDTKNNELKQLEKSSAKIAPIELDDKEDVQFNINFSNPLENSDFKITEAKEKTENNKENQAETSKEEKEDVDMESSDYIFEITETDKQNLALFKNKDFSTLSEEDIYRLLRIEKIKRAKLSYTNENVFKPEISKLKKEFEKWVTYDNELKRFLTRDIPDMNKRIQTVKKKEKL